MQKSTQILVIGGGPAGSTAATLLAQAGFGVTLIEREVFPRYHIGESLLPSCLEILDLLGVRDKVEAHGFQQKHGGYFAWGTEEWDLVFAKLRHPYSFQVVRSEFDHLLLEHAKSQGVHVHEGVEIRQVTFDGERPCRASWAQVAQVGDSSQSGEISFDFLVDASGRAGILATHYFKSRHYHSAFQNVALWGYWKGAHQLENAPKGAIAVGSVDDGWIWGIPLHNGTMSVGLVTHKETFKEKRQQSATPEQIYMEAIDSCPLIKGLVEEGELVTKISAEQDYSYLSDVLAGPGYCLAGDAACFIDPLLSTGVHLATFSGMLAAASISSMLRGEVTVEEATTFYAQSYRHAYLRLVVIVSGLYQQYNGKQSYFWEAQQLSHHDYGNGNDLNEAFLHVVSGMEDLLDTQDSPGEPVEVSPDGHVLDTKQRKVLTSSEAQEEANLARSQLYNKVFMRFSLSPDTAVDGLYVTSAPRLGLARA
ncbi:MAG TPA: NAD(P)/FAD-dependent oxidoreductase [Ktedonobacteraceae bacterium]|nr:NAD(P)/FAD-dependent oxidoreductase [Ktedonobacteraceae bacterium]